MNEVHKSGCPCFCLSMLVDIAVSQAVASINPLLILLAGLLLPGRVLASPQ